jgi:hypothetical protein
MISDDGDRIFFTVVPPSGPELYVRENGTTTTLIANGIFRGATPDGSKVFASDAAGALIRHDLQAGTSTVVGTGVRVGTRPGGVLGYSDDGSLVYFASVDDLVDEPVPDGMKLYLWEDAPGGATIDFVAPMSDRTDPQDLSRVDGRNWSDQIEERTSRVSHDGEQLLFLSSAQVTAFDNAGTTQVYLFETDAGVRCLSCPSGAPAGDASLSPAASDPGDQLQNLTDDGRLAFFQSPEPLVLEDGNGRLDVYQYDVDAQDVALLSSGQSGSASFFGDASSDGDDVFINTRERLVGWDQDELYDLYDARVGGGLPEPPTPLPACAGDECQGQSPGRPGLADPASSKLQGSGDANPRARASFRPRRLSRATLARLARGRTVSLEVRVNRPGKVSGVGRAKLGKRQRMVLRSSKIARKAGTVQVRLRLSKSARRWLATGRRLRVGLSVRFTGVREARRMTLNLAPPKSARAGRRLASDSRRAGAPYNMKGW